MRQKAVRNGKQAKFVRLVSQVFEHFLPLLKVVQVVPLVLLAEKVSDHEHAYVHERADLVRLLILVELEYIPFQLFYVSLQILAKMILLLILQLLEFVHYAGVRELGSLLEERVEEL